MVAALQLASCTQGTTLEPPPPGGAYLSTSAGATFDQSVNLVDETGEVTGYIASFALQNIYRVPHTPSRLYLTLGQSSLVVSEDGGQTWREITTPLTTATGIVDLENETMVVSGTGSNGSGAIIRSLDRGTSWETILTLPAPAEEKRRRFEIIQPPSRGQPAATISTIVPDPFVSDRVYAATSLGDVLIGEQSGKLWKTVSTVTTGKTDPVTGQRLTGVLSIVPSPHQPNEILIVSRTKQLFRLVDDQLEEIKVVPAQGPAKQVFDATYIQQFPEALFVAVNDGAMVSRDSGATWEQLDLPLSSTRPYNSAQVVVSPTNPARLIVALNSVILRSEDGGDTWSTTALGLPNHIITDIAIDPTNAARVILVTAPLQT